MGDVGWGGVGLGWVVKVLFRGYCSFNKEISI